MRDTAILSFGFFKDFYVFSIFIIPRIILTTTHTHRTYHIMKIYNNLVQWGNGSANDQMFLKTRKMQRIKMFPFPYWLLWIYYYYYIFHLPLSNFSFNASIDFTQKKICQKGLLIWWTKVFPSLIKNKMSGTENFEFVSFGCYWRKIRLPWAS